MGTYSVVVLMMAYTCTECGPYVAILADGKSGRYELRISNNAQPWRSLPLRRGALCSRLWSFFIGDVARLCTGVIQLVLGSSCRDRAAFGSALSEDSLVRNNVAQSRMEIAQVTQSHNSHEYGMIYITIFLSFHRSHARACISARRATSTWYKLD